MHYTAIIADGRKAMKDSSEKREIIIKVTFWCLIFAGLMIFFQYFHPLTIFNTDDWTYVKFTRRSGGIFPSPKEFNPIKVLPENMTAVAGFFGAYIIRPFCGNYVRAIEISYGLFLCMTITVYCYLIVETVSRLGGLGLKEKIILGSFVTIIHFLPFVVQTDSNMHFFYELDSNGVYNNVVPAMFNAMAVCFSIIYEKEICAFDLKKHRFLLIVYLGMVYLAINSSLFSSIILASYAFCKWIQYCCETKKIFAKGKYCIFIGLMWICSLLFEYNGGRASQVGKDKLDILGAIVQLRDNVRNINVLFLIGLVMLVCVSIITYFACRKKKEPGSVIEENVCVVPVFVGSGLITIAFNVLLSSKVGSSYLCRCGIRLTNFFFLLMLSFVGISILLRRKAYAISVFSMLTFILILVTMFGRFNYADIAWSGISRKQCVEISNYIIDQYMAAYEAGETHVEIRVPCFEGGSDNYPLAEYGASRIASNLRWHGMTKIRMDAVFIPDKSINEMFGM